jgi:hypothetical protein
MKSARPRSGEHWQGKQCESRDDTRDAVNITDILGMSFSIDQH